MIPPKKIIVDNKAEAINAALRQEWKEAIRINCQLLKNNKTDVNLLNRLGFAYMQNGQFTNAKKIFNKVIKLDRYNQIANRNLKKLSTLKVKNLKKNQLHRLSPLMFLEDPGKTKIAICINLAPNSILSSFCAGQEVCLKAKKYTVEIRDANNTYLGALPDDLSFKLIKFLKGGNCYQALIKGVGKNYLSVFLRETIRGKHFLQQPSFINSTGYFLTSNPKSQPEEEATPEEDAGGEEEVSVI